MLSYQEALTTILSHVKTFSPEKILTSDAIGRYLAEDITAPTDFPTFQNSGMDGYAVQWQDTVEAHTDHPVHLKLVGESTAGGVYNETYLQSGQTVSIMTGGRLPQGATAIIPVENANRDQDDILVYKPASNKEYVRAIGADWTKGEVICPAATRISPEHIPALFSHGITHIKVWPRPKAGWISTGSELVDDLSQPLGPTQIYNSTAHFGRICLQENGCTLVRQATTGDTPEAFKHEVTDMLKAGIQLIISTGAVSVGAYDFVRQTIESMGATVHVHRAKVRPGKPILFATFPNGALFIGLPGNPVSTAMGFRMFICPVLQKMLGQAPESPLTAKLAKDCQAPEKLTVFLRATAGFDSEGYMKVSANPHQESFKTRSLINANCWLIHPEGTHILTANTWVEILPLWPRYWQF